MFNRLKHLFINFLIDFQCSLDFSLHHSLFLLFSVIYASMSFSQPHLLPSLSTRPPFFLSLSLPSLSPSDHCPTPACAYCSSQGGPASVSPSEGGRDASLLISAVAALACTSALSPLLSVSYLPVSAAADPQGASPR